MRSNEQKLIDITFQIAGTISDPKYRMVFDGMTHEQRMHWVAQQLETCGFVTQPMGASWGVLVKER